MSRVYIREDGQPVRWLKVGTFTWSYQNKFASHNSSGHKPRTHQRYGPSSYVGGVWPGGGRGSERSKNRRYSKTLPYPAETRENSVWPPPCWNYKVIPSDRIMTMCSDDFDLKKKKKKFVHYFVKATSFAIPVGRLTGEQTTGSHGSNRYNLRCVFVIGYRLFGLWLIPTKVRL